MRVQLVQFFISRTSHFYLSVSGAKGCGFRQGKYFQLYVWRLIISFFVMWGRDTHEY